MAESIALLTQKREDRGTHVARRLRRQGRIPAVVYGHKEAAVSISLDKEELEKALRHGVRVVDLKTDRGAEKALIREVQWDHLGKELLHIDFARVALDERVVVEVRLELRGHAPGVTAGGVLDQPMHSLPVECLAIAVPDHIRVNVGELQIGSAVHVRDLVLPEGVKAMAEADAVVLLVKLPTAESEAAPATAIPTEETSEPQVIGRQAKAAEEEEAEK